MVRLDRKFHGMLSSSHLLLELQPQDFQNCHIMEKQAREQSFYNRDYQKFIQNLQKFHGSKGTGFKRVPYFGGKELDLFLLYKTVTSLGGFVKVTEEKKWREVAKCFNLPASCTNAAFSLRQYYLRYLASYERFHFFGEDVDDAVAEMRKSTIAGSMQSSIVNFSSISNMPPEIRIPKKLGPLGEPRVNNFDRLVFSLMSGLPNEVDFALNICTLLSNVTNSIFNLAKAPAIVDLMLGHVGIFSDGASSVADLYKEWYQESDRDFVKFWRDSIDDDVVKEIFENSCVAEFEENDGCRNDSTLTNSFADVNTSIIHSVEANRALQVCVILHNFSYEGVNCLFISAHESCRRFLIYCAGSRLHLLRKTALDTLDNLADRMILHIVQDKETLTFLRVLHSFLFAKDRVRKVRAMSIISKLSFHEENEDIMSEAISEDAYEELIKCLTIPDIQLILNALDALYYLSNLGEATATAIVMVYRSIDILVCLVKVHAESYGNRAIAGFRIVENKNSIQAQKHLQQVARSAAQQNSLPQTPGVTPHISMQINQVRNSPKVPVPLPTQVRQDYVNQDETEEVEPEIFAARWISAFYELSPGNEVKKSQILTDYLESCREYARKGILNAADFHKILCLVIPGQYWKQSDTDKDDPVICGIKRRVNPLVIKNRTLKTPARVPDTGTSQGDQSFSVPIRPIPIPASNSQQNSHPLPKTVTSIPHSSAAVLASSNIHEQQERLEKPSSIAGQGVKQSLPATSVLTQEAKFSNVAVNQSDDTHKMPLQLLQQHVNAQGKAIITQTNPSSIDTARVSQEAARQTSLTIQQSTPKQQTLLNQKLIPVQFVQSQALQQTSIVVQNPAVSQQATVIAGPQSAFLQTALPGVVTTAINAASKSTDIQPSQQHSILPQNATDANAKLNVIPKPSGKEKQERKKAVKAARDIINADIRASNQDPVTQCHHLAEKMQKEMQQNFLQFHLHQQSIQAIQNQLQQVVLQNQQSKLPQNVMDDIHARVRNHHTQMQLHYQKLQQLQLLLQQVQIRLAQEQKLTNKESLNQTTKESTTDKSDATVQGQFNSPRVLRKQSSSVSSVNSNSITSSTATAMQHTTVTTGAVSSEAVVSTNGAFASSLAPAGQKQLYNNAESQLLSTLNTQYQLVISSSVPPHTISSASSSQTSQGLTSLKSSTSLPSGQPVAGTPVQVLANTNPLAQHQTVVAQVQNAGTIPASSQQIVQLPLAANGPSSLAFPTTKPVSVTHNTLILPRPQAMPPVSNQTRPTLQTSGIPGQTLLLQMPVAGIPNQIMHRGSTASVQMPLGHTAQGMPVLSSNHLILTNTSTIQTKVPSTSIRDTGNETGIIVPSSTMSSIPTCAPPQQLKDTVSPSTIINQPKAAEKLVSTTATLFTMTNTSTVGNPVSIRQSLPVVTSQSHNESLISNGPTFQAKVIHSQSSLFGNAVHTKTEMSGAVLTNGQCNDSRSNSYKQQLVTGSVGEIGNISLRAVSQNGIDNIVSTPTAALCKDVVMNKSQSDNNNKNSTSSSDFSLSNEIISNINDRKDNDCNISVNIANNHQNNFCHDNDTGRKRPINESSTAENIEHKRMRTTNQNHDHNESSRSDNKSQFDERTNKLLGITNQENKIPRVNGLYTRDTSKSNELEIPSKIPDVDIDELLSGKTSKVSGYSKTTATSVVHNKNAEVCTSASTTSSSTLHRSSADKNEVRASTAMPSIADAEKASNSSNSTSQTNTNFNEKTSEKRTGNNCRWAGCRSCFATSNDLLTHMVLAHAPTEGQLKMCKVPGCRPTQRPRGSMICHFKQIHCTSNSMTDNAEKQLTLPELLFPKVVDLEREDESPVTRSVRLTAALILRNIARNSAYGRKVISAYESQLVMAAISSSEASSAIACCLEELTRKRKMTSDCLLNDEAS